MDIPQASANAKSKAIQAAPEVAGASKQVRAAPSEPAETVPQPAIASAQAGASKPATASLAAGTKGRPTIVAAGAAILGFALCGGCVAAVVSWMIPRSDPIAKAVPQANEEKAKAIPERDDDKAKVVLNQVNEKHIEKLAMYLTAYKEKRGKWPPNEAEFKKFIGQHVDKGQRLLIGTVGKPVQIDPNAIESLFVSPRDLQPYAIRYDLPPGLSIGVRNCTLRGDNVAGITMEEIIEYSEEILDETQMIFLFAFEKTGVNGIRNVIFSNATNDMVNTAALPLGPQNVDDAVDEAEFKRLEQAHQDKLARLKERHLDRLAFYYAEYIVRHWPPKEAEFKKFILSGSVKYAERITDADPLFVSPRDLQPYVVRYDAVLPTIVEVRKQIQAGKKPTPTVTAYEKTGLDGRRRVFLNYADGYVMRTVSEVEFRKLLAGSP